MGFFLDDVCGNVLLATGRVDGDRAALIFSNSINCGIAVISFDLSSTTCCPKIRPFSVAHAPTV